ncbi:hypothetical protein A5634_04515 [Mycobacterium asiaticum]|uniref:Uncharacterized protein n=1 Tax=Mycobacterium asiaticum TaxID=1790 RepID=A0A1A3NPI3_MYCAS|nr:hypothetical protein [Mycobacterium asiaticum]OBK24028.1 hypothetical protein A5634_04515 [Mycobacterium asiaticum]
MADDELDSLYSAPPNGFTARRAELAKAAKQRGDTAASKQISALRKPTTAAWIVNRLTLQRPDTTEQLTDLGDNLRSAHAAMDGERVRALSAAQHKLINELVRVAFEVAEVAHPTAALRDDITGTLQAAIADPEVRARLGRLSTAERWSGFATFRIERPEASPESPPEASPKEQSDNRRREELAAAVAAAEQAKSETDSALTQRRAEHDEAQAALHRAQRAAESAEHRYRQAQQRSEAAAESVARAKSRAKAALKRA